MTRRNRSSPRRAATPGWVLLLFGFGLGLAVAVGLYLHAPRLGALAGASLPPTPDRVPAPDPKPSTGSANGNAKSASDSGEKPKDNKFDFYEILPQYEVVVPEAENRPTTLRSRPVQEPGRYWLQAGSFRAAGDAERMRATLALLGIESFVQPVRIDDNVFNRVRIGPIGDLSILNRTIGQLRDAGIEPQLLSANN